MRFQFVGAIVPWAVNESSMRENSSKFFNESGNMYVNDFSGEQEIFHTSDSVIIGRHPRDSKTNLFLCLHLY